MAPGALLGPPEIYLPNSSAVKLTDDSAMDDVDSGTGVETAAAYAAMQLSGLSMNGSATYSSTGNPSLDFFFHVVPDTPPAEIVNRLRLAWAHDPVTALKLICNLRGVRGTGKSDRGGFYTAALWLHEHHPKTLACNIKAIAGFGYLKDMLEILYRLLEGPDARRNHNQVDEMDCGGKRKRVTKEQSRTARLERTVAKAKKGFERYNRDSNYRFLHDRVSDLFTELLKADMEFYNSNQFDKISLASKWCPNLDSSYDKATLMCECIARKLFPKADFIEYQEIEDKHYAYRIRNRLRKEVLVPLHKALELPEVYMCAQEWDNLPFNHVPSVAMNQCNRLFYKHEQDFFEEYLEKVKSGKSKIAAGALLPHEIIESALNARDGGEVAELQWKRMVDDLAKEGKLSNCLAICCRSCYQSGVPMDVSTALGLLISELSEDPWKGKLIIFGEHLQLHEIEGDSLKSKAQFIQQMDYGANDDFQRVFDRILQVAVEGKLTEEQMIQKLFVFSDREFDEEKKGSKWETDYEVIQRKFLEEGYKKVPEIVFWNLTESKATPVLSSKPGVALVSGFSRNLVTLFLEGGGIVSPEAVMLKAISGVEYQKLVVVD